MLIFLFFLRVYYYYCLFLLCVRGTISRVRATCLTLLRGSGDCRFASSFLYMNVLRWTLLAVKCERGLDGWVDVYGCDLLIGRQLAPSSLCLFIFFYFNCLLVFDVQNIKVNAINSARIRTLSAP